MNDLQQKYERAKANYATALEKLDLARHTYENGAGKAFAEAKKNRELLGAQLDSAKQASENAKATLSQAMRQSNGERTPEVNRALAERRDADDLIDQFGELLSESDRLIEAAQIDASTAARHYLSTYESAAQRWAEMNVLAALAECGERIARAMAVKAPNGLLLPTVIRHERGDVRNPEPSCEQLIIRALRDLAVQCDERPYVQEIGTVKLGAMEHQDILSIGQMHKLRPHTKVLDNESTRC
jgi:hypothetical protein